MGRRWLLRLRLIHPFPTLLNVVTTVTLAFIATKGEPPVGTVLRLAVVMLLIQSAIGATNDYRDQRLDAVSKPWKPLVAGALSPRTALIIAVAAIVLAALFAATLGLVSWLLAMLGLGLGLVYNLWLKRTPFSALPYLVAIPLLPVWVWTSVGYWRPGLLWLLPLGVLVGLSLHLANALADFDSDTAAGTGGLAQHLGWRPALFISWLSMAVAFALAAIILFSGTGRPVHALLGSAVGLVLFLSAVGCYQVLPRQRALPLHFGLLALATAVSGAGWLAAL